MIWKRGEDGEDEDIIHVVYPSSWVKHDTCIAVRINQSHVSWQRSQNGSQQDRQLIEYFEYSPNNGGITRRRRKRSRMNYHGSNGAYCFQGFMRVIITFYYAAWPQWDLLLIYKEDFSHNHAWWSDSHFALHWIWINHIKETAEGNEIDFTMAAPKKAAD